MAQIWMLFYATYFLANLVAIHTYTTLINTWVSKLDNHNSLLSKSKDSVLCPPINVSCIMWRVML